MDAAPFAGAAARFDLTFTSVVTSPNRPLILPSMEGNITEMSEIHSSMEETISEVSVEFPSMEGFISTVFLAILFYS